MAGRIRESEWVPKINLLKFFQKFFQIYSKISLKTLANFNPIFSHKKWQNFYLCFPKIFPNNSSNFSWEFFKILLVHRGAELSTIHCRAETSRASKVMWGGEFWEFAHEN